MRIVTPVFVSSVLMLAVGVAAVARAGEVTTLRAGEADGANVIFVFDESRNPPVIVLRTARVGVAGSRIEVTVDKVKNPVFSHIFGPGECKFGDGGSACEVTIPKGDAAYRVILARFRHGRQARVTVQDAGVMKMDQTVPLGGFAKAMH